MSDDPDLQSRSQLHLKVDLFFHSYFNSNISDNVLAMAFKLCTTVQTYAWHIVSCLF